MSKFSVTFTANEAYLEPLKVAVYSFRKFNSPDIDVVINSHDDQVFRDNLLRRLDVLFYKPPQILSNIPCYNEHKKYDNIVGSKTATFLNPFHFDVILNCDVDILFQKDCFELFKQAERLPGLLGRKAKSLRYGHPMLNGGHIFIPKSCSGQKIYDSLIESAVSINNMMDDWNISRVFSNRQFFLDDKVVFYPLIDRKENIEKSYIIHYVRSKPWLEKLESNEKWNAIKEEMNAYERL